MNFAPIDIHADPAEHVQPCDPIDECNRLAAINEAKRAYLRQSYTVNRLPPRRRVSHMTLLGLAFVLAMPLAVIGVGLYAIVWAVWTGVK